MQFGLGVFIICFMITELSRSVFGISVSVEITHEEHFEVTGLQEFDVIQVFDKKIQQELNNDEDILRFEKSHEQVNVTPTIFQKNRNISLDDGEAKRSQSSSSEVNMTSQLYSGTTKSHPSRFKETTSQFFDEEVEDKANMTSLLDQLNVRTHSSSEEVEDRVDMTSHSLRHKDTDIQALLLGKMWLHKSRGNNGMRKGTDTPRSNVENINSTLNIISLPSFTNDRVNVDFKTSKQEKHVKMKHRNLVHYRKIETKDNKNIQEKIEVVDTNITVLSRSKRKVDFNIDNIANADWKLNYTTRKKKNPFDDDSYQVITADDKIKAEAQKGKTVLLYVGTTVLSVVGFSALAFCFIKDPATFIIAFATGCPCFLLIVPCITAKIRKFQENSEKLLKENVNMYMPGIIIHEDGTVEHYKTTPEEVEAVMDIIDELQS